MRYWLLSVMLSTALAFGQEDVVMREPFAKIFLPSLPTIPKDTDIIDAPFATPHVLWTKRLLSDVHTEDLLLSPALQKKYLVAVGGEGDLVILDQNNGKTLWKTTLETHISSPVSAGNDFVFTGTSNGQLLAFNPETQQFLYQKPLSNVSMGAPAVDDTDVYVKTIDDHVYAFRQQDGHVLWHYQDAAPEVINQASSAPVLTEDQIILGLSNGKVVALDKKTGHLNWSQQVSYPEGLSEVSRMVDIDINPVVADHRVFVSNLKGRLAAYDLETGKPLWQLDPGLLNGMTYANHALYTVSQQGEITALDPEFGTELWHTDRYQQKHLSAPVILKDHLIVADNTGTVHWLQLADGVEVSQVSLGHHPIAAAPVVADNTIYVQSIDGVVARLSS